jgi:hypothetical protein
MYTKSPTSALLAITGLFFVKKNPDGSGYVYQVAGDIQNGMSYGHKPGRKPEDSATYVGKEYIGTVSTTNYPRIESIVNGIEPPKKQLDGPNRINPQEPLRRCQEWTAEAIQALKDASVIDP